MLSVITIQRAAQSISFRATLKSATASAEREGEKINWADEARLQIINKIPFLVQLREQGKQWRYNVVGTTD